MIDFCFFLNQQNKVELFPSLTNAISVVSESVGQTCDMKGKRQLSVVRREDGNIKQCFVVFNYVYGSTTNSCGICLVIRDKYPTDIKYLFACLNDQIKDLIEEGKILYIDGQGEIKAVEITSDKISPVLNRHLDKLSSRIDVNSLKLSPLSGIPNHYLKNGKYQTVIHELSDNTWEMADALNYNNIVIVTEEIEDENIYQYKNIIRQKNEEITSLNMELDCQKDKIIQLKAQKNKYGYVIVLFVLLSISIGIAFAIRNELNDSKEQHEMTKNALKDSLANKNQLLNELQIEYNKEKTAHNELQNNYTIIERNLREEHKNRIALENQNRETNNNIRNRQPFVVTDLSYNRHSGDLEILYYGVETGTYKISVKGLYIKSNYSSDTKRSYDYGNYDFYIEEGLHTCNLHIGKYRTKNFVLMQGNRIIGGDTN